MQIIVLGMHRSGTSPLTRLLNLMGAYVGVEGTIVKANPENPKGFWERKDIVALDKEVLATLGADWHRVAELDLGRFGETARQLFKRKAINVLLNLEPHRPWVIKEPRMCLLFPLWRAVLEVPICIHIYRSPLQVAQSLQTRNGFPLRFGVALWEKYVRTALASTIGLPRVLVAHRQLLEQPVQTVHTLYEELVTRGVYGLHCPSEKEILTFIEPDLYRARGEADLEEQFVNQAQRQLFRSLEDYSVLELSEIPPLSAGALETLREYEAADTQKTGHEGNLYDAQQPPVRPEEEFEWLTSTAWPDDQQQLYTEIAKLRQQRADTQRALAEKERQLSVCNGELKQRTQDLTQFTRWMERWNRLFTAVMNSQRWRLGDRLGALYQKVWGGSPLAVPQETRDDIMSQFLAWRQRSHQNMKNQNNGGGSSFFPSFLTHTPNKEKLPSLFSSLASMARSFDVDIIVCVHNALEDVKACLTSVIKNTTSRFTLYIVNDGSDENTTRYLQEFVSQYPSCVLLENAVAKGYTRAANQGLRASTAGYVILLNSDTIVPQGWLEKLLECGESNPRIGVVGPLSNAASWQSVPELSNTEGEWAVNELPAGYSTELMAQTIALLSEKRFPHVPFLNGFCLAIKRAVIEAVGYFDQETFPHGYGEENDYCLRVANAGFSLAVADHGYIFHAKSRSYERETKRQLTQAGNVALREKHGAHRISQHIAELRHNPILQRMRSRVSQHVTPEAAAEIAFAHSTLKILFLLPVQGGGGGAHSVVQETVAMRQLGVSAHIAVPSRYASQFTRHYAALKTEDETFYFYDSEDELVSYATQFNVAVATIFHSVDVLHEITRAQPALLPVYYVQDYEPWFFPQGSEEWQLARASYSLIPGMVHFAKTRWLCQIVEQEHGVKVEKVTPSLDQEVYFPAVEERTKSKAIRVSAMIRPATPRRGARRTMTLLKKLKQALGKRLEVHIFGCSETDPNFRQLERGFRFHHHGLLVREQVAQLLRHSDIFLDCSDYQAFGRTGLEAMACGCVPILPVKGGVHEYAQDRENALLVNTQSEDSCYAAVAELISDAQLRQKLRRNACHKALEYSLYKAALSELTVLNQGWRARMGKTEPAPSISVRTQRENGEKISVLGILPRRRFNQWPASAYIRVLLPLRHPTLQEQVEFLAVPIEEGFTKKADVVLVQRTAVPDEETASKLLDYCRRQRIRVVYETDDQLFAIPPTHEEARDYERVLTGARILAQHADLLTVATQTLADSLKDLNANILVLPNVLDEQLWFPFGPRLAPRRPVEKIRILYMGSRTHLPDLLLVEPAIKRLFSEYGERLALEVVGGVPAEQVQEWFTTVRIPEVNYPEFVEWLCGASRWTIGIAPLVETEYNRCKSHIKYLDYAALGLTTICSDVEPYRQVIRNGVNGFVVENSPEAWYQALKRVIEDEDLRSRLSQNGYRDIVQHHVLKDHAGRWLAALHRALQ